MDNVSQPIGIFDSGVGGLTVLRRMFEDLPFEDTVYLGDTARVPYGTKSPDTVRRYASACANVLLARNIKLLVVACNTASAHAIEHLQQTLDIPVVGVVEPGARAAAGITRTGRVGVIGTHGTITSEAYPKAIESVNPDIQVWSKSCPLFVPLAEEGWIHGEVPEKVAEAYLGELLGHAIDTLVLGCTHYPLLIDVIRRVTGDGIAIVDSAEATVCVVHEVLDAMGIAATTNPDPIHRYLSSDAPEIFAATGRRFLNRPIGVVEWVDC